jgi:DNA-binding NarL/FixJ family response regulator
MSGEHLGKRELEVLELIGQGFSTREIAAKLQISIKTVESHREHIKDKLSLSTGAELARYAFNWTSESVGGWRMPDNGRSRTGRMPSPFLAEC